MEAVFLATRFNFHDMVRVAHQPLDYFSELLDSISLPKQIEDCTGLSIPSLPEVLKNHSASYKLCIASNQMKQTVFQTLALTTTSTPASRNFSNSRA